MGEDAHVTGTLDTNVYDDRAILLQLNLPDFDAQLVFPSVITRDSWFVVGLMILVWITSVLSITVWGIFLMLCIVYV